MRSEFTVSLNLSFGPGNHVLPKQDPHAGVAHWKPLSGTETEETTVNITEYVYDLRKVTPIHVEEPPAEEEGGLGWLIPLLIIMIIAAVAGYYYYTKKHRKTP